MRFETVSLGDVCCISSSKRIFAREYQKNGIPFYRGKEIIEKHNGNDVSSELYISEQRYDEIKTKYDVPKVSDILLTSVGTLGIAWLVNEDKFYFKDGNLTWLRSSPKINPYFLYWWLNSPEAKYQIDAKCIGSTQKALTIDALNKFQISLPSLDNQMKIGNVLQQFQNKIAINTAINKNLEEQILSLYHETVSTHDCNQIKLGDLCTFQEGYVNPPQGHAEYFDGSIKWLRAVDINESYIINTSRTLTKAGFDSAKKSALLFEPDTIAISKSGTIGRLGLIGDFMCGNRAVINIKPNDKMLLTFLYAFLKSKQTDFSELAVGSVQKNLYVSLLEPLIVKMPSNDTLASLCKKINGNLDMIKNNCFENDSLATLRDTLLPRLMSGEIDVSNIEI